MQVVEGIKLGGSLLVCPHGSDFVCVGQDFSPPDSAIRLVSLFTERDVRLVFGVDVLHNELRVIVCAEHWEPLAEPEGKNRGNCESITMILEEEASGEVCPRKRHFFFLYN